MGLKANIKTVKRVTAAVGGRDATPAKWKGAWNAETAYAALEKVSRDGSSFVCIAPCAGVDPAEDVGEGVEGVCWLLIAKGGRDGVDGTVAFEELTEEQRESLKGEPFTYEDFTEEQLEALKGEPFTYKDFTEEQIENLKGKAGKSVYVGPTAIGLIEAGEGIALEVVDDILTVKVANTEEWTFTLEDDTTVTKKVVLV